MAGVSHTFQAKLCRGRLESDVPVSDAMSGCPRINDSFGNNQAVSGGGMQATNGINTTEARGQ